MHIRIRQLRVGSAAAFLAAMTMVVAPSASAESADELGIEVVGFRQEQAGLEGEVYLSSEYDVGDYLADFRHYTGTSPAIVGVVVQVETDDLEHGKSVAEDCSDIATRLIQESQSVDEHMPGPANPPENSLTAIQLAHAREATNAPLSLLAGSNTLASYSAPPEEWAPMVTEIAAVPNLQGDAVVLMTSSWTGGQFSGSRATAMPSDWGIEIEVSLWNNELNRNHPFCPTNEVREFWGVHDVNSWTLMVPNGSPFLTYGSYLDSQDATDRCARNALTVGIGYPQNLPVTVGHDTVQTLIVTDRGTADESVMSAYYQAVSNDCNDLGREPHSDCMDLNIWRSFPGLGSKPLTVLGEWRVERLDRSKLHPYVAGNGFDADPGGTVSKSRVKWLLVLLELASVRNGVVVWSKRRQLSRSPARRLQPQSGSQLDGPTGVGSRCHRRRSRCTSRWPTDS